MSVKSFFKGGTDVPHRKNTEESKTVKMQVPKRVIIPMQQHIGAPCEPTVKKKDLVKVGQVIGTSSKFVHSPIHSSVSGEVKNVAPMLYPGGSDVMTIEIETDNEQTVHESVAPKNFKTKEEFLEIIKNSGLVGLGGAGFPTHIKLSPPPDKKIDTLIINAAECEPYITSDYREILENTGHFINGIKLTLDALGIEKAIIGIEDNKPEAIKLLKSKLSADKNITVTKLKTRYPQGAEKMLIYAVTGRKVPPGKLPMDVSVIVLNVQSVSFISEHMETGMPLIKKRVTVDGSCINEPKNIEVLIGTTLQDVFDYSGGVCEEPFKVIMGGPMMGVAQHSMETSVIKNTNALLAFNEAEGKIPDESPCIRCGKCVSACPMDLLPLFINQSIKREKYDEVRKYNPSDCIECGCCSYVCPAKIALVQSIRMAKAKLNRKEQPNII
jgi:electron transport complex protein RnfC